MQAKPEPSARAGAGRFRREYWYRAGSRSFEIDGTREGGVAAEQRIDFFIREQAAYSGACVDQVLTGSRLGWPG